MSSNNHFLKALIESRFPNPHFFLTRYSYLLKNEREEVMLLYTKEANFPVQNITNCWEVLSEDYFFGDLYDIDHFEMALEVIESTTHLNITPSQIRLIGLNTFEHQISYWRSNLVMNAIDLDGQDKLIKENSRFLNLYYYADGFSDVSYEYWSDNEYMVQWLPIKEALALVDISNDKTMLEMVANSTYVELLKMNVT